jgi:hypothetical protein
MEYNNVKMKNINNGIIRSVMAWHGECRGIIIISNNNNNNENNVEIIM